MKFTSLLSNLITENARLQLLFDKFVKPNPKNFRVQGTKRQTSRIFGRDCKNLKLIFYN